MMICTCSREQFLLDEMPESQSQEVLLKQQISYSGFSAKMKDGEAQLDENNIEEAESSLREALSLNNEEARALLGRLEYQRGNVEAALQVFDGIDIGAIVSKLKHSLSEKNRHRKGKSHNPLSTHAACLLLEAIFLKAKSLQELDRPREAADECKKLLNVIETTLAHELLEGVGDSKLQETISKAVELLPELWKQAGLYQEAIAAYRRGLLTHWNLTPECCARIQKDFAVFLLYWGVEASAPSLAFHIEGAFIPRNNIEEAILLLLILLRKSVLKKIAWDPDIMEHLTYALSVNGQLDVLAHQFEEVLPGTYTRAERWYNMAICYFGAGKENEALNLLKKCLSDTEQTDNILGLLLAAKLCVGESGRFDEGVEYARRAVQNADREYDYMKGVAYLTLGRALSVKAKQVLISNQRTELQVQAFTALQTAASVEKNDAEVMFQLAMAFSEQRKLDMALDCAKTCLDFSNRAHLNCWRLVALILSGQQRYADAQLIVEAALEETGKWDQADLLRTKAKLQVVQGKVNSAIETYQLILALLQAQKKSFNTSCKVDKRVTEVDVWQDLTTLYADIQKWSDAEVCLEKMFSLKPWCASSWHAKGSLLEAQGRTKEAMLSYNTALSINPDHVVSKLSSARILRNSRGPEGLPVARSLLQDALQADVTFSAAWYELGLLQQMEGHAAEAADCFHAAHLLEDSDPVEDFHLIV